MEPTFTALDRAIINAAPEMFAWLQLHYEREEGSGETDRPEYVELRTLLAKIKGGI